MWNSVFGSAFYPILIVAFDPRLLTEESVFIIAQIGAEISGAEPYND